VGDAFLKWLYQNAGNAQHVEVVHIDSHEGRTYQQFPDDAELENFDASDRKFVAVCVARLGKPPILQATDSKWIYWCDALRRHAVQVRFLCQRDTSAFLKRKKRS
jgi:hypothetical protein